MSIVQLEQLSRRYGDRTGVDSLDLHIAEGEIFGFLGPNGAGKTTTIRLLMGLLKPDAGRAEIAGFDCWSQSARVKHDVGYLPGDLRLYPWLTLRSALPIVSSIRHADIAPRAGELADQLELEPNLPVRQMSRGTRQKLGLVLAMAHRPRLLILDEPTSGLDPLMQATLADLVREAAAAGQTVFFSSHTLSEVDSLCDRVAIIRHGRIIVDEPLEVLRDRAPRQVELVYANDATAQAATLPPFVEAAERQGRTWRCQLHSPAMPLVVWASTQPLDDVRIGRPDLEALFHSHYHDDSPPD